MALIRIRGRQYEILDFRGYTFTPEAALEISKLRRKIINRQHQKRKYEEEIELLKIKHEKLIDDLLKKHNKK